jgi:hypothetical protein
MRPASPSSRGSRHGQRDEAAVAPGSLHVTQPAQLRERSAAMLERVSQECAYHIGRDATLPVRRALHGVLQHRDALVPDDHDPRLLHPARTILILLSDTRCRDSATLAAAAFVESMDTALAAGDDVVRRALDDAGIRVLAGVPVPDALDDDEMLERLVAAEPAAAVVAIAERLDHARHLHLRQELPWRELHAQVRDVYAPAAARLEPKLGRRLDRWAEAFAARRLFS